MGLDTSHDAWHGAYSAFDSWRSAICSAMGGKWPQGHNSDMRWYWGPGFSKETHPGLRCLLCHSDCDGEIDPATCALLADELTALLPFMDAWGLGCGHIAQRGGYADVTRTFIQGCRRAAAANEPLEFH